jgi:hypothetical protein
LTILVKKRNPAGSYEVELSPKDGSASGGDDDPAVRYKSQQVMIINISCHYYA